MESKETDKRRTCQSLFLYVKKTRESNSLYKKRMICSRGYDIMLQLRSNMIMGREAYG